MNTIHWNDHLWNKNSLMIVCRFAGWLQHFSCIPKYNPAGRKNGRHFFFRNRKFAIGNISFVHCFCALFCKLFQIIGEISGSEVLALIRNELLPNSSQDRTLHCLDRCDENTVLTVFKYCFRWNRHLDAVGAIWFRPWRKKMKHWCEQNKSFCIQLK